MPEKIKNFKQNKSNRMIHIRLDEEVHKRLRIVAAEKDVSIQELVTSLIERDIKPSRDREKKGRR